MGDVNLDGGGVDMYTDRTNAAMGVLSAAGSDFGASWAGHWAAIHGHEVQLGRGPMGAAFRTNYNPASIGLQQAADQVSPTLTNLAADGRAAVTMYVEADQRSRQGFGG
ncbi:hypothetical protein [Actinokineospora sp.]|uniref:hypothetical protein n=1 Tax=Actinokineospora sp. TaxID=1872133 RepID=UPI00403835B3